MIRIILGIGLGLWFSTAGSAKAIVIELTFSGTVDTQGATIYDLTGNAEYRGGGEDPTAPRFKDATVYSCQYGDSAAGTGFFARVSGPSPEDIASFTATGPSGTFNLTPGYSFRESGLTYRAGSNTVLQDGTYTFSVTDKEGRTAVIEKSFAYNDALPKVDEGGMSPAAGAYLGTTTPTLSAPPAAGDYRYQIMVWDMGQKAVWYAVEGLRTPSVTVPSGVLQANTPYSWAVRVWDVKRQNFRGTEASSMCLWLTRPWWSWTRRFPFPMGPINSS